MPDSPDTSHASPSILTKKKVLITGAAGFIGFHLAHRLLIDGCVVLGIDNLNPYYDVDLKQARLSQLKKYPEFQFAECALENREALENNWKAFAPDIVVHLAAQAGVRYSIENPDSYIHANVIGTYNLLEVCRDLGTEHLLAASTSSIYGSNPTVPFQEGDPISSPLSLYAATKGATELLGHTYSSLFEIPMTFFRFFTVYGPWGRPDMAAFKFTKAILNQAPIDVYNNGKLERDFTYIDDLIEAVVRLAAIPPVGTPSQPQRAAGAPFRVVNIGKGAPDKLMDFISEIESALASEATKNFLEMQPGEMLTTYADTSTLVSLTGYRPSTPISVGIPRFIDWYKDYYGV